MIRKLLSLMMVLMLALGLTAALAETATEPEVETQWVPVALESGATVYVPGDFYTLVPGMTDEELAPLGLTAAYVDQLLMSQGMQGDFIAPDMNCEVLASVTPYTFSNFGDTADLLLRASMPALKSALETSGVTVDSYDIARWDAADGSKEAYIIMEQRFTDPASGMELQRLHAYSVKNNYAINMILIDYTGALTEAQSELLGSMIGLLTLPQ